MAEKRLPTINRVLIIGNLTRDPELRETNKGVPVVNFRIAASRRFRDSQGNQKEETCFVGVVAWAGLATACADRLFKSSSVYVEGELQSRNWETDDGQKRTMVEIHAYKVQFLDKREQQDQGYEEGRGGYNQDGAESDDVGIPDSDMILGDGTSEKE